MMNENSIARARERVCKAMAPALPRRDARLEEAVNMLDKVAPELRDLVAGSDTELVDIASVNLPAPAETEMPDLGAPLTAAKHEALETQVLLENMGLGEIPAPPGPHNWLEARGLRSEPVITTEEITRNVIAIAKLASRDPAAAAMLGEWADTKSATSGLTGEFVRDLAARAEEFDPDSKLSNFLKCLASGDKEKARAVIRTIVRNDA